MQLSFLYAATLFAAAWASPVPDSANQAVATQPLSKRAGLYYVDTLQATSYSITNWLHSKHIEYYRVGGAGGDPFTDLKTLEAFKAPPTIEQVVLLAGNEINHVKLSGFVTGAPSVKYEAPHGHDAQSLSNPENTVDVHLNLGLGEWLTFVRLQAGKDKKVVYIGLETNLNNKIEAGALVLGYEVTDFWAPKGYTQVVGFHGTDGDWIDSIGPIWA